MQSEGSSSVDQLPELTRFATPGRCPLAGTVRLLKTENGQTAVCNNGFVLISDIAFSDSLIAQNKCWEIAESTLRAREKSNITISV
eukprot:COSAG02_NODE_17895_length_973_cov_0.871854_1_plen_86_part_00